MQPVVNELFMVAATEAGFSRQDSGRRVSSQDRKLRSELLATMLLTGKRPHETVGGPPPYRLFLVTDLQTKVRSLVDTGAETSRGSATHYI